METRVERVEQRMVGRRREREWGQEGEEGEDGRARATPEKMGMVATLGSATPVCPSLQLFAGPLSNTLSLPRFWISRSSAQPLPMASASVVPDAKLRLSDAMVTPWP